MSIILDDVSCLPHLLIIEKLLNYSKISRHGAMDMMVTYLKANPGKARLELYDTRGCHVSFLVDLYEHHMSATMNVIGDGARVVYHELEL